MISKALVLIAYSFEVLVIVYFHIKSFDNTPSPAYDLPQTEISQDEYIDAIDPETGKLTIKGWTKAPNNISYNQNLSKVYWPILSRVKQWNYFSVVNDKYLINMAHANLGVIKTAYINILDVNNPKNVTETLVKDFFGSYIEINPMKKGEDLYSAIDHPELKMKFMKSLNKKEVDISVSSITDEHTIEGRFSTELFKSEGLTVMQDQTEDGLFHEYNTKVPIELKGELKLNGNTIMDCKKKSCLGIHDYGRTIGKYFNSWIWGTTFFRTISQKKKVKVCINISLAEKENVASGTAVFINDKLYKLDSLLIKKIKDDEWSIKNYGGTTSSEKFKYDSKSVKYPENQIDLKFKVSHTHKISDDYFIIEVDFNTNYGFYSGNITTKEHHIEFENEFGLIEQMFSRW